MKIQEIKLLIKSELSKENSKKAHKVYLHFYELLDSLLAKELDLAQWTIIEVELDAFISSENGLVPFKKFKKQVALFTQFLQKEFKFTPPNYFMQLGIGVGMCFGVTFGTMSNIGMGISLGMLIGLAIGKLLDNQALEKGLVIGKEV